MKPKKKICKGNYRSEKGFGCGKMVIRYRYGLCLSCFRKWLIETEAGQKHLKKQVIPQAKSDVKKQWKKEKSKIKEKIKTLGDYKKDARYWFQKYIRERDKNQPCITCQKHKDNYDAGHFYKAELYTGLIFVEENCHAQCRYCNRYLGGNENQYRKALINKYGIRYVKKLDEMSDKNRLKKYTKKELIEIKEKYKSKYQKLKL